MKKSTKLQFLAIGLLLALLPQNQYANLNPKKNDIDFSREIALGFIASGGIAITTTALKLSSNAIYQTTVMGLTLTDLHFKDQNIDYAKDNFPEVQTWYDTYLTHKYRQAHFEKKPLRSYNDRSAAADHKNIFLNKYELYTLNKILKKQNDNLQLSTTELNKISEIEWRFLHEATHINNNDAINNLMLGLGVSAGLEFGYQKYKKSKSIAPVSNTWSQSAWKLTKSLPKRGAIFAAMATTTHIAKIYHAKQFEARADAFANKHSDINALKSASIFFKNYIEGGAGETEKLIPTIFYPYPTIASRLQKIEDEIKRREVQN